MTIEEIKMEIEKLKSEKWLLHMADHFTPEEWDRDAELSSEIYKLMRMLPQAMPDFDNMTPNSWELDIWQETTYKGVACKELVGEMTVEEWREMKKREWRETHGVAGV